MAQSTSSPSLPQELKNAIIGYLHDCTDDLKACALSSRSLLHVSQSYLFYDVSVYHPRNRSDDRPMEAEDCAFVHAALGRLAAVLVESPHLLQHIRSLAITTYLNVVLLVADMGLTHLQTLVLYSDITGVVEGPLVAPLQRLIALESLTRVEVSAAAFSTQIFSSCSQNLTELAFDAAEDDDGLILSPAPTRTEIKCLQLCNSPFSSNCWLTSSDCPFNFVHLVDVAILASMSASVRRILDSAKQSTVVALKLTASDIALGRLDLARFSALRQIYLVVPHICHIVSLLSSISDLDCMNIIQKITFDLEDTFCDHHWSLAAETRLARFDAALANLPLFSLREVVFRLPRMESEDLWESEAILKRALCGLNSQRILRVEGKAG
ncbi:hypothetical protein B0H15DRAFT_27044 [Mycena belliarum]|uniref:Uncharacterized protein n=1 Tax=Mycena belliarum TaxID=1033014 RepID=A0AAD6UJ08_9AGAR|nr:hypothetical protein B0H15DRAFT_27044 [Mycena belliae]